MCRNTKFGTFLTSGRHTECACYVLKPLLVIGGKNHGVDQLTRRGWEQIDQRRQSEFARTTGRVPVFLHVVATGHHHVLSLKGPAVSAALDIHPKLAAPAFGPKLPAMKAHLLVVESLHAITRHN